MLLRSASAIIIALSAATIAQAQTFRSEVIEYNSTILASSEGVSELRAEIRIAARRVCEVNRARGVAESRIARECFENALANAMLQMDTQVAEHAQAGRIIVG